MEPLSSINNDKVKKDDKEVVFDPTTLW